MLKLDRDVICYSCLTIGHYIEPHDDTAYIDLEDTPGQKWTRDIAMIYYLAKDWKEEMGGSLVDLTGDETYVPEFNSLIAFRVPRMHEVTACTPKALRRFSVFGWFLSPDEYPQVLRKDRNQTEKVSKIAAANKALADDDEDDADGDDDEGAGFERGGSGGGGGGSSSNIAPKIHKKKMLKKELLKLKLKKKRKNKRGV